MLIYCATNTQNNKRYVGKTTQTLKKRIANHLQKVKGGTTSHFYNAIRKWGIESFSWSILFETDDLEELNLKEDYYIQKLQSEYNHQKGGFGGSTWDDLPDYKKDKIRNIASKTAKRKWKNKTEKQKEEVRELLRTNGKKYGHLGHAQYGERCHFAKLKVEQVLQILKLEASKKYTRKQIAEKMGVTPLLVSKICLGQIWNKIPVITEFRKKHNIGRIGPNRKDAIPVKY